MKRMEMLADMSLLTPTTSSVDLEEKAVDDQIAETFFDNSSSQRVNTDALIFSKVQAAHPSKHITVVNESNCNLLAYASAGNALAFPINENDSSSPTSLKWRQYLAPRKRLSGGNGGLADRIFYGEFRYAYDKYEFYIYLAEGRDGLSAYPSIRNYYVVGEESAVNQLILAAGQWSVELHDEIWVFNQGMWMKDPDLYKSIQKASWDDVILDDEMKDLVQADVKRFFDSQATYEKLRVPWKRGLIFYGPPGNGKTISLKAISHGLYARAIPAPTLYVRSLTSYGGPEYSLSMIFGKARQEAPCLLVFEDLDSIVTDQVRSFFLNEVDGLSNNDGILMVGSTNHLERLDPGISKRPSRFDRKYLFPDPSEEERVKYCEFWKRKLRDNKDIEFPQKLCKAIASITGGFSFAYIQEAFVAALLEIASNASELTKLARQEARHGESITRPLSKRSSRGNEDLRAGNQAQSNIELTLPWLVAIGSLLACMASIVVALPYLFPVICAITCFTGSGFVFWKLNHNANLQKQQSSCQGALIRHGNQLSANYNPSLKEGDDLEHNILWLAIKKQVKILRETMGDQEQLFE